MSRWLLFALVLFVLLLVLFTKADSEAAQASQKAAGSENVSPKGASLGDTAGSLRDMANKVRAAAKATANKKLQEEGSNDNNNGGTRRPPFGRRTAGNAPPKAADKHTWSGSPRPTEAPKPRSRGGLLDGLMKSIDQMRRSFTGKVNSKQPEAEKMDTEKEGVKEDI